MTENEISKIVVECAIEVHKTLGGPGLLESVYEEAMVWELKSRALQIQRQVLLPVRYKGPVLATALRIDLLLSGLKLGLVINFGQKLVKDGIHRVVNGL